MNNITWLHVYIPCWPLYWFYNTKTSISRFVYFPLCSVIPWPPPSSLPAPASHLTHHTISHTSLLCPYTQRASESHLEFFTCSLYLLSTLVPSLPPNGNISSGKTRRCKEVQKASTVFPYGLASAELCTHTTTHAADWHAGKHALVVFLVRQPSLTHSTLRNLRALKGTNVTNATHFQSLSPSTDFHLARLIFLFYLKGNLASASIIFL